MEANFDGRLVVTVDLFATCLCIYPLPVWEEVEREFDALPVTEKNRRFKRRILGHANDVDMDGSGRILLPPVLRKFAGLEKKLVLVGQGKKLELWSEQQWASSNCLDEADLGAEGLPEEIASISSL